MNDNLSKTLRTDAAIVDWSKIQLTMLPAVSSKDMRQLETELAAAQERIDFLDEQYSRQCGATQEWMRKAMDAQEREEGLRRALESVIENGPCCDPDCCDTAIKCEEARNHAKEALAATPSGPTFRERMQEAWKLVNAMAGQEPWQRAEDWLEQNKEFSPLELVQTKGLE